ncbi:MAG: glycosyltransferase [Pseudomonadota bacterium]
MILYAGSLHRHYGTDILIEAARQTVDVPHLRWVVVGHGRERPAIEAAAQQLANLRYEGALPRRDMAALLGAADAGLVLLADHPCFRAVMPGKLTEYLAAGLPVICAVPGQAWTMVSASKAGWNCLPQALDLAAAARSLAAQSIAVRRRAGEAGQLWAHRYLDPSDQGRALAKACSIALTTEANDRSFIREGLGAMRDGLTSRASRQLHALCWSEHGEAAAEACRTWLRTIEPAVTHSPLPIPDVLR